MEQIRDYDPVVRDVPPQKNPEDSSEDNQNSTRRLNEPHQNHGAPDREHRTISQRRLDPPWMIMGRSKRSNRLPHQHQQAPSTLSIFSNGSRKNNRFDSKHSVTSTDSSAEASTAIEQKKLQQSVERLALLHEQHEALYQEVQRLKTGTNHLALQVRRLRGSTRMSTRMSAIINAQTSFSFLDPNGRCIHMSRLNNDAFSLMKVTPFCSFTWIFSIAVYVIQLLLLVMILVQQSKSSVNAASDSNFQIPFKASLFMGLGQCMAIIVTVAVSKDIFIPVKEVSNLWITNIAQWSKVVDVIESDATKATWLTRIALPSFLQLVTGCLALTVSFFIIVQSNNVIVLFAEFAAMGIIAEIDNIAFWFADAGYVGDSIRQDGEKIVLIFK